MAYRPYETCRRHAYTSIAGHGVFVKGIILRDPVLVARWRRGGRILFRRLLDVGCRMPTEVPESFSVTQFGFQTSKGLEAFAPAAALDNWKGKGEALPPSKCVHGWALERALGRKFKAGEQRRLIGEYKRILDDERKTKRARVDAGSAAASAGASTAVSAGPSMCNMRAVLENGGRLPDVWTTDKGSETHVTAYAVRAAKPWANGGL